MGKRTVLAALIGVLVLSGLGYFLLRDKAQNVGEATPVYLRPAVTDRNRPVLVLGEFRSTSVFERWLQFKEENMGDHARLYEATKKESPALIVFLGNQVNRGSSQSDWSGFDEKMKHFMNGRVPALTVAGTRNHAGGLAQTRLRFPDLAEKSWYSMIYINLGFVFLDSNFSQLSGAQWEEQKNWFIETLKKMQDQKSVQGIIVFAHHPMFTNAGLDSDSARFKQDFFGPFASASKTMILVSGNKGAYEKFYEESKYFLVSGGGGAPRTELAIGESATYKDLFDGPAIRPFHYLLLLSVQGGITFEIKGFDRGEQGVRQLERTFMPFKL